MQSAGQHPQSPCGVFLLGALRGSLGQPVTVALLMRLVLLAGLLTGLLLPAPVQADRAFSQRFSTNINGDLVLIGNAQLSCTTGVANCAAARAGGAYNNNAFTMTNVDVDSDGTTFNSTSANLNMPAGSTVVFAGLYWSGQSTDVNRSRVLLRTPTSFGYSVINAAVLDTSSGNTYQGFRDITAIVNAAGSGSYTVANIITNTGAANLQAGWSLIVVFQHNSLPLRNHTVFDGLVYVNGVTITLPISGFLTPLSGPVTTRLGSVNYDGDYNTTGDRLRLNAIDLTDVANPLNNFYNSTITDGGVNVTSRNPSYANTLGVDVERVNVPAGVLGNGATSATMQITSPSGSEVFWQGVATFMTDLYVPIITPNILKTATDVNGGSLVAGDILRWTVSMTNTGLDSATNLTVTDPIPAEVTYSPGSLVITSGANAGAKSDSAANDQAEYLSSGPARVVFRLGTGANGSNGGTLAYNESTAFTFDTIINAGLAAGTPINNTVTVFYNGQTIGDTYAGSGAAASAVVVGPPTIAKSFVPNVIDAGAASVLTIVVGNPAGNPGTLTGVTFSDTYPAGLVNAATPNAQAVCTPGATAGPLTGGIAGGSSIGMSLGANIPPNGNCTITVNVTANTVANYTNTTSAAASSNGGSSAAGSSATLSVGKPRITKAFAPTAIASGGTSTITFVLTNLGASGLTGVSFSDTLTNMQVAAVPAVSNGCGGAVTATAGSGSISLAGGSIAATSSCTLTVDVTSAIAGVHPNTTSGVSSLQSGAAGNPSNTVSLTVIAAPVLSKSFSPTSVQTNVPSTLSITVSNPNTSTTITGVTFTDVYPANLRNETPASPTLNCTPGSTATMTGGANGATTPASGIGISAGSLAPGGSCTVTVSVEGTTTGNKVNTTSTATSTNAGTGAAATATLNITNLTAPTVTKAFGGATVATSGTTTLAITLSNSNASAVTGVAFSDNYPAFMVNTATPLVSNTCGGTVTAVAGGTLVALSGGTIPASGNCAVTVNVRSSEGGFYTNTTGTITTANAGTFGPAIANINVLAPPQIAKSFSPDAMGLRSAGGESTLTITLSNPTTATASLTGVAFIDNFPANLVVDNPVNTSNTCGGTYRDAGGGAIGSNDTGISLTGVTLAPNASCSVTVDVASNTVGSYINTTNAVTSTNGGTGGTATATVSVGRPDIAKSFTPAGPVVAGSTVTLTLTLSNPTAAAMTAAAFTDNYPAGLTNTAAPGVTNTCGGSVTAAANGSLISLSGGTIPGNGTCVITVNVSATQTVLNTIPAGGLTEGGGGSNANPASATLVVYDVPEVVKLFAPDAIAPAATSRLTITISNATAITATGVAFTDNYPAGLVNTATPGITNTCGGVVTGAANGSALTLAGGSIPANTTCTVGIDVTSNTAGVYVNNTGTVSTTSIGSAASESDTLTVMGPPTVAKSFSPATVLVNDVSVLTITLTNANPVAITGATFTDTYPAGLINDTPPNVTSSCTGGTLSGSAGGTTVALSGTTIPASSSCSVTIRVKSATAGSYNNSTGTVTTTNAGTGAAANATLTVNALMPSLSLLKLVSVISDPDNSTTNPKSIPGAISAYTLRVTNTGPGTVDNDTVAITDPLPSQVEMYVGDLGGVGAGPVVFTDSSPASGLSWVFTALGDATDSLEFSNDGGATWTYTPVPDGNGFDTAVTHIRLKPKGVMSAAGGSNPYAEFLFRVRVK